jgi:glycosyltransferase involved in cell wall biosynthesis
MGASSRVRTYQFLPLWEAAGYQVRVSSFFNEPYLKSLYGHRKPGIWNVLGCYLKRFGVLLSVLKYDVLIVEKELFPFLPAYAEFFLKVFGKKYIVDYDDAVFHNYDMSKNWLVTNWMGGKIDQVMKRANQVWAGSEYLEKRSIEAGAGKVVRLATVIDGKKYWNDELGIKNEKWRVMSDEWRVKNEELGIENEELRVKNEELGIKNDELGVQGSTIENFDNKKVWVGWIGSPSTMKYLKGLMPVLERLGEEVGYGLLIVNGELRIKNEELGGKVDIKHTVWTEEGEVEAIRKMDIGIMPLPDDPWERGKCAYKLIQYMACGLPVVASPVGMNTDVVRHGENGFLASTEEEWIQALKTLILDADLRKKMGEKGLELVKERFTVERNFGMMLSEVERVISGKG